jgi:hypothetical protein
MNWDQVQMVLSVVIIILCIFSLISSVRRDLNEVRRLRFRWVYLIILGLVPLNIPNALGDPEATRGIRVFLTIIGILCVLPGVIGESMNRSKQP